MNRHGPLSLIGGREHWPGSEAIGRRLLDETGVADPLVAIVPVAAARRQLPLAAALARNHWTSIGARVSIAGEDPGRASDLVARADVVVLTGGHPNKLVAALAPSSLWDEILDRWAEGAAISGSSAGAMALFEWRIRLYPPNPLALLPGLGPLSGFVAAPHFDRFRAAAWGDRFRPRLQGLGILGLDEATAIVGRDGGYSVLGRGAVTVIDERGASSHTRGSFLPLALHRRVERYVPLSALRPRGESSRSVGDGTDRALRRSTSHPALPGPG